MIGAKGAKLWTPVGGSVVWAEVPNPLTHDERDLVRTWDLGWIKECCPRTPETLDAYKVMLTGWRLQGYLSAWTMAEKLKKADEIMAKEGGR